MIVLAVYSLTEDPMFSPDKPDQTLTAEVVRMPEELPSQPRSSPVIQSPEVKKESAVTTEASVQQMSVVSAAERVTLPTSLTETQG